MSPVKLYNDYYSRTNFLHRRKRMIMVNVYYRLVKAGTWKIEQVPELWRTDVQAKLGEEVE